jgi:photosystem II stability/assembly factor-like uncharacterized protein
MKIFRPSFIVIIFLLSLSERGAYSQWQQVPPSAYFGSAVHSVQGFGGGAMAICGNTVWVGSNTLWFSEDTGKSWHLAPLKLGGNTLIHDINFLDSMNGLVATSDFGIMKTSDGGSTWTQVLLGDGTDFWKVAFNGSPYVIHATGSSKGVCFTSTDGGNSWKQSTLGPFVSCMAIASDHTVYVFAQKPFDQSGLGWICSSTDYGLTWRSDTLSLADGDSYTLSVDSCIPNRLYLLNEDRASSNDGISEIFITSDAGKTWSSIQHHNIPYFTGALATTVNSLFATTNARGSETIIRSTDKGQTWTNIGDPAGIAFLTDSRAIEAMDDNILFALDAQNQLWYTVNCGAHYFPPKKQDTLSDFSSARIIKDSNNITVHLPIYFHSLGAYGNVSMVMHYPPSSLKFLDAKLYNEKKFFVQQESWNGRTLLKISSDDLRADPNGLLGTIDFLWTPLESDCAPVDFDSIQSDGCLANQIGNFHGIIGSTSLCPTLGVAKDITPTEPIFSFSPNPAGDYGVIDSKNYTGKIIVTMVDNSGKVIKSISGNITSSEGFKFSLSDISSGMYTLRISYTTETTDLKIIVRK